MDKDYKYDVAFSLCKQDIEFVRKLIAQLNPSIKIFFYENNQEELINKSGPEVFGRVFNQESRIVVILSRKEWSESYYTDIERNTIIDRTSVKNQGYNFLMVIPMMPGETPSWYPSTRIYADPQRFTIEKIAAFIEFKITEEGGTLKQLTLEDRYKHLQKRIEERKKLVQLQTTQQALDEIKDQLKRLHEVFKQKSEYLENAEINVIRWNLGSPSNMDAYFSIGNYIFEARVVQPDEMYDKIVSTQDFTLVLHLCTFTGIDNMGSHNNKKTIVNHEYKFLYSDKLKGWAVPFTYGGIHEQDKMILFRQRDPDRMRVTMIFYDLIDPISIDTLIDNWFQELLIKASSSIEKYL